METSLNVDEPHWAQSRHRSELEDELSALTSEVKSMRDCRPSATDRATLGMALAVEGGEAASLALDVLLDAISALHGEAIDGLDAELLLGACVDAEQAYEASAATVLASAHAEGLDLVNLDRAFRTEGQVGVRERLRRKSTGVAAIAARRVRRSNRFWRVKR
jgi:hypothetical protein